MTPGRTTPQEITLAQFLASLALDQPPSALSLPQAALWWDAKGNWQLAHSLIDELETQDAMAVHAYLHRKEGEQWNADYWYARAGKSFRRPTLQDEWQALAEGLIGPQD